jgi:hypothetical protein
MKIPKEAVKIKLGEFEGWLLPDIGLGRPLVPFKHCDKNGNVVKFGISFAHFFPERDAIVRFRKKIGTSKDLIFT